MFRIIVKFNNTVLKEIKIDQDVIVIGRDPGNDIQVDNMAVSREHARIIKEQNYYLIEDLKSTNGTFVNGKKINKKFLTKDDEISIGKHILQVALEDHPAIAKEPKPKGIDRTYKLGSTEFQRLLKN